MPVIHDVDHWCESRDGRYFFKQCARLLAGVVTKDTLVREVSSKGITDHPRAPEPNVVLGSPPKSAIVDVQSS